MNTNMDETLRRMAKQEAQASPQGYEARLRATLQSLNSPKSPRLAMRIATIAAALCLLVAGGVYALTQDLLPFDWQGKPLDESDHPIPTTQPELDEAASFAADIPYDAIQETLAEGETYRVRDAAGNYSSGGRTQAFTSLNAMREALAASAIPLSLPAIPEGFALRDATLQYGLALAPEAEALAPARIVSLENGLVVEVFSIPDTMALYPAGYSIVLEDVQGNTIHCSAVPQEKDSQLTFGATSTGEREPLLLPGFSQAIYFSGDEGALVHTQRLYARKDIENTPFIDVLYCDYANTSPGLAGVTLEIDQYASVLYAVEGSDIAQETLVACMVSMG